MGHHDSSRIYENSKGIDAVRKKLEVLHNSQSRKYTGTLEAVDELGGSVNHCQTTLNEILVIVARMNHKLVDGGALKSIDTKAQEALIELRAYIKAEGRDDRLIYVEQFLEQIQLTAERYIATLPSSKE